MALTRVAPNIISVANNVTNKTVGNTTSIASVTFDGAGVVTAASNVAISGAGITANTIANSAFQTGSVENYMNAAGLGFGMRNRIINGAMVIDQRNAGASVTITNTADNTYTLDRWAAYTSVTSKFSVQQSSIAPTGFSNSLLVTSLAATTVGTNDRYYIAQFIEGFNTSDLMYGTADAKTTTLSFWVRSSLTGTFGGTFQNSANNRNYPFTYTISSANTWEQKSITVAGDTTGTWVGGTNGIGLKVFFGLGVGSAASGTAGAWGAGNYNSATGATSVVGTNGATFYITGVQLEVGSTATSFDYRPYGTELALCQRYCFVEESNGTFRWFATTGWIGNATTAYYGRAFPVTMRTSPSLTVSSGTSFAVDGVAYTATTAITDQAISSPTYARLYATVAGGLTAGQSAGLSSNTSSRLTITYSAEL